MSAVYRSSIPNFGAHRSRIRTAHNLILMHQSISPNQQYWRNCQAGVPAEVVLGSPKTPHCKHLGICRMNLERDSSRLSCKNSLLAYLRVDAPTGRLLIHFVAESITPSCAEYFFSGGVFTLPDDFQLPAGVVAALNLDPRAADYRLQKGRYLVLDDDYFATISLRLTSVARAEVRALAA